MKAYYNEIDPKNAAWLRELIKEGLIANGHVDERSIVDVPARDLKGYHQHHFFAGVGGWSYALRLAGCPDSMPVWTASLPCQPFSAAGKGLGKEDERHLLPHFLELVKECRPDRIFGEQVERAIGHGWLDDLQATMEAENYAVGHCVLGAHSIGATHIRQRLYWVANSISEQREQQQNERSSSVFRTAVQSEECVSRPSDIRSTFDGWMGISNSTGSQQRVETAETARYGDSIESASCIDGMADTFCFKRIKPGNGRGNESIAGAAGRTNSHSSEPESIDWIYCRDNKYRPIKRCIFPLVDGVSEGMVRGGDTSAQINADATQEARAMRLKGYGNAIVPQLAAEFIRSYLRRIEK